MEDNLDDLKKEAEVHDLTNELLILLKLSLVDFLKINIDKKSDILLSAMISAAANYYILTAEVLQGFNVGNVRLVSIEDVEKAKEILKMEQAFQSTQIKQEPT